MIKTFSQRLLPPFSGQVQIAESDRARAVSVDGENWEIHFIKDATDGKRNSAGYEYKQSFVRAAYINQRQMAEIVEQSAQENNDGAVDERIVELIIFIQTVTLPFPAADKYEYWLLDPEDESPLALIFSCTEAEQMASFPVRPEWTALPAAVMPIDLTEDEQERDETPVNYRVEQLVNQRAGTKPRARWFTRRVSEPDTFPPYLIKEDWQDEAERDLCQRYIERQSTRLLMLQNLEQEDRRRLEQAAKSHALEVDKYAPFYPEVVDETIMNAIHAEARLRKSAGEELSELKRRDGVLYI